MNKYIKNLNRIEFVVTSACTGRCKHCSQGDHKIIENIDKNLAVDAVKRIAKEYNISSVMTFGGEPLLCADTVCAIHNAAQKMNIPHRQLITNGYFSKDFVKIKSVAEEITQCGINDILISVDAFHQETIHIEYVKFFAEFISKSNVKTRMQPAWLISPKDNNPYNIKTKELLKEFRKIGIEPNDGNIVFPSGNALKYLREYFEKNNNIKNPYEEDPYNIKSICFSANGDILGDNIYKNDIIEIINNYTP